MNQLIKIRQISDYDIDAASSVEQIDVRHKAKLERNALNFLCASIMKVNQSRNVMGNVRDSNGHVVGFVAQLRLVLVVAHSFMQGVNVRLNVLIPQTATVSIQDRVVVFKVRADSVFRQNILVEAIGGDRYRVLSGLAEGDRIVTEDVHSLAEGQRIRIRGHETEERR